MGNIINHIIIQCGNTGYLSSSYKDIIPMLDPKCQYCDCILYKINNELCRPCNDLYEKKIIRRDCGQYLKNTTARRLDILYDKSFADVNLKDETFVDLVT
jgi:hypothetical protein